MKCDELKRLNGFGNFDKFGGYYDAEDVDAAIAELKAKLDEKDKEIESLKASHYAESVDAGMRERRLRMELWLVSFLAFFARLIVGIACGYRRWGDKRSDSTKKTACKEAKDDDSVSFIEADIKLLTDRKTLLTNRIKDLLDKT